MTEYVPPTRDELRELADRAISRDADHIGRAEGETLNWLIAQLANMPTRVDERYTMNDRYLRMSAASTLRVLRDLPPVKPREPLTNVIDGAPTGYMESDRDFVLDNVELCALLLDRLT
jgi:hypothetical protein